MAFGGGGGSAPVDRDASSTFQMLNIKESVYDNNS
jgi:hypothetical protein